MSTLQYYVYYKVEAARVEELRGLVEAMFREIEASTAVRGQLQRRRDDPSTFMEIYAEVPADCSFDSALDAALGKVGFTRLGIQRVTEIFQCA